MKNILRNRALNKSNILTLFTILIIVSPLNYINKTIIRPPITVAIDEKAINFNTTFLQLFSLGNKQLIGSLFWVKTLLDSDLQHYKNKDLNSWMFLRFDTITDLSPRFYEAYLYGGQYLSIVKDDDFGAERIYQKGLIEFPEDFWLNFNGAYHYYFELHQISKAQKLYRKIQYHELAKKHYPYLPSVVAKISALKGDIYTAQQLLKLAYKRAPENSKIKQKFYISLYAIKAEIDLQCLNDFRSERSTCERLDLDGSPYIRGSDGNGIYYAVKKWKKFRPHNQKGGY